MHKIALTALATAFLTVALSACGNASSAQTTPNPTPAPAPAPQPQPAPSTGFITGKVTNAQGDPIEGVEVDADNTIADNSNLITRTDANGNYKIDVSLLATTWHVTAHAHLQYNGYTATIDLVPDNDDAVPGLQGGVRNFTLKPKPVTQQDPYGNLGLIIIDEATGEFSIDFSKVQVTLTPIGKLADGSTGAAHTFNLTQTNSGWLIPNVMWGTYAVTATFDGQPLQLRRRAMGVHDYPWSTTYQDGFYIDYYLQQPNMFLEARTTGAQ